jgi:hypothetical protein
LLPLPRFFTCLVVSLLSLLPYLCLPLPPFVPLSFRCCAFSAFLVACCFFWSSLS